jgi:peptide/nickel transport system substrate-binding protein
MDFIAKPDLNRAKQLLADSGYDGKPVVVLQPTDLAVIAKLPLVAVQLLRETGFKVEMQSMDWQTLVSRVHKTDGWSIYMSGIGAALLADPVSNSLLSGACDKAAVGWPCDSELEHLRDEFARAFDDKTRKLLADQVQVRAMTVGTYVPLGEYVRAVAARKTVTGFVIGTIPSVLYWNVEKNP